MELYNGKIYQNLPLYSLLILKIAAARSLTTSRYLFLKLLFFYFRVNRPVLYNPQNEMFQVYKTKRIIL